MKRKANQREEESNSTKNLVREIEEQPKRRTIERRGKSNNTKNLEIQEQPKKIITTRRGKLNNMKKIVTMRRGGQQHKKETSRAKRRITMQKGKQ
jgi:hypothetical protein